jgi:hypothetical protein
MRFVTKLLALCTALIGTSGLATTIDFDTGIPPGCVASYTQDGVTFLATDGLGISGDAFGVGPNLTPGIVGCAIVDKPFSTIRAQLAWLVSGAVSVDLGDFNEDADVVTLSLFDVADGLLSTISMDLAPSFTGMVTLTTFGVGIDHVIFGGTSNNGSTVYADNFAFIAPTRVPEPLTLALVGLGLAGLGFSRRKQRPLLRHHDPLRRGF